MAKRLTTAQWLGRLNRAGRTDAEIGAALGRSTSYIQKVRTGPPSRREAANLRPAAKALATAQRRRTTGTARPLPNLAAAAPRRPQVLRGKEHIVTADRRHRFYVSHPRKDGKPIHPGQQLITRIQEAGRRGDLVRLTITWKDLIFGTGHRSARTYHDEPITLWNEGEDAYEALADIRDAGDYRADPDAVLENLTMTQDQRVQHVSGIIGWQLHTFAP